MATSNQPPLVIIIGIKGCGKTSVGQDVAKRLNQAWIDSDRVVEKYYAQQQGDRLDCKTIVKHHGWDYFRHLETQVFNHLYDLKSGVISTGGSSFFDSKLSHGFKHAHLIIYLSCDIDELHRRWNHQPPPWLTQDISHNDSQQATQARHLCYTDLADQIIDVSKRDINGVCEVILSNPHLQ